MEVISHQTVRLSRGAHRGPTHGMCVMELASVLAGERFGDRPESVCPVIGALLRAYNDAVDDARRQELIPYAARVIASRASRAVRRERAARCVAWIEANAAGRRAWWGGVGRWSFRTPESCATAVVRSIKHHREASHPAVLGLIDELLAVGERDGAPPAKLTASMLEAMLTRASERPTQPQAPAAYAVVLRARCDRVGVRAPQDVERSCVGGDVDHERR